MNMKSTLLTITLGLGLATGTAQATSYMPKPHDVWNIFTRVVGLGSGNGLPGTKFGTKHVFGEASKPESSLWGLVPGFIEFGHDLHTGGLKKSADESFNSTEKFLGSIKTFAGLGVLVCKTMTYLQNNY